MRPKYKNYLRTFRKELGLSQRELALALGRGFSRVSELESGLSPPSFRECLKLRILFREPVEMIWPKLTADVHAEMQGNIKRLLWVFDTTRFRTRRKRARVESTRRNLLKILNKLSANKHN
jgi:transcriptional regulator with XRE-family HTH domain